MFADFNFVFLSGFVNRITELRRNKNNKFYCFGTLSNKPLTKYEDDKVNFFSFLANESVATFLTNHAQKGSYVMFQGILTRAKPKTKGAAAMPIIYVKQARVISNYKHGVLPTETEEIPTEEINEYEEIINDYFN